MSDRRILIVAHRTAASPKLLAAVTERAARGPCKFTLLVPRPYWDPDTEEAAMTLELAIPLLDVAAGSHVQGIVGATDPYEAVRKTLGQYAQLAPAAAARIPQARLVMFEELGHAPQLQDPARFQRALLEGIAH